MERENKRRAWALNNKYSIYLSSEAWAQKRQQRLSIAKFRCAACTKSKAVQVHHLTYERIFNEDMGDLLPLCDFHHDAAEHLVEQGKLLRRGDVLFLAAETLRLIVPLRRGYKNKHFARHQRPIFRIGGVSIDARNPVQLALLNNTACRTFLLNHSRPSFKIWLETYTATMSAEKRGLHMNNGCILYDRLRTQFSKRGIIGYPT